jgi:Alw26I/Eco31I/Esp3I family type II restriction m6 adenine DNA methyltransferase
MHASSPWFRLVNHLDFLKTTRLGAAEYANKTLSTRAAGRFYTPERVARCMIPKIVGLLGECRTHLRLLDPFCGDGRLIEWLLEGAREPLSKATIEAHLWDYDEGAVTVAFQRVANAASRLGLTVEVFVHVGDTFRRAPESFGLYDVVFTNPPWEMLKPDRRETDLLGTQSVTYIGALRDQDNFLVSQYPLSQPSLKFSGWGTNLARVGTEVSLRLTVANGVCAVVSPASLFADQVSASLRKWMFEENRFDSISLFPAESKLFAGVDQPVAAFVACAQARHPVQPVVARHSADGRIVTESVVRLDNCTAERLDHRLPLHADDATQRLFQYLADFPRFVDLEHDGSSGLWAGREVDETNFASYLCEHGKYRFIKGRLVDRYVLERSPYGFVGKDGPRIPKSADHTRIVWRDVSRPTQRRRLIATVAPPRTVAGNSLNLCYFRDDDNVRLKALLAVVNSYVFEFQVRTNLATAHVSLGAVRKGHVPDLFSSRVTRRLSALSERCLRGEEGAMDLTEVSVAKAYGLSKNEFEQVLVSFPKVEEASVQKLTNATVWRQHERTA